MKRNILSYLIATAVGCSLAATANAKQSAGDTTGEVIGGTAVTTGLGAAALNNSAAEVPSSAAEVPSKGITWNDEIDDAGKASAESTPEEALAMAPRTTPILKGGSESERLTEENVDSSGGEYTGGDGGMDNVYRSPQEEEEAAEDAQNGSVNSDADLAQSTADNEAESMVNESADSANSFVENQEALLNDAEHPEQTFDDSIDADANYAESAESDAAYDVQNPEAAANDAVNETVNAVENPEQDANEAESDTEEAADDTEEVADDAVDFM